MRARIIRRYSNFERNNKIRRRYFKFSRKVKKNYNNFRKRRFNNRKYFRKNKSKLTGEQLDKDLDNYFKKEEVKDNEVKATDDKMQVDKEENVEKKVENTTN